MLSFAIRGREIGNGAPPYFVAELGTCHRGSVAVAKENARIAVQAGADCVKTELFYETEVLDPDIMKTYSIRGRRYEEPLIEHMRRYQLTLDQHREIKEYCDGLGVAFMATAHDRGRVDFLRDIGADAVKIASPDIVHYPLIRCAAASGLALFLDTGGAWQHEVEMAVKVARDAGCERLVVNHNPQGHPAPADRHDLLTLARFKELFACPVGLADHYDGYEMVYAAAALGADAIEKPVSEDRFIEECEHIWAVTRTDLAEVIAAMRRFHQARGRSCREMGPGLRPQSPHRVALAAARDLAPGEPITEENVVFGKPRRGIGVEFWDEVEGRVLATAKRKGEFIRWEDL